MKPASEKRTRAWPRTRFWNFQLANSGYNRAKATHNKAVLNLDMMNMIPRVAGSDSALRAAPSGTSSPRHSRNHQTEAKRMRKKCLQEKKLSVAYLANQKPPTYLSGVVSI